MDVVPSQVLPVDQYNDFVVSMAAGLMAGTTPTTGIDNAALEGR